MYASCETANGLTCNVSARESQNVNEFFSARSNTIDRRILSGVPS